MTIGERIRSLREEKAISQTELALKCNISKQTLYKYETGIITNIPSDKIESIASVLHTTPAYLMGWEEEPIFADEDFTSYVEAPDDIKADFCLTAKGDSMIGARIYAGDIVFIREQPIVENGEIAAVIIDDEATLKRWYYYPQKHKLMLVAENPKYEPLVYMNEELNEIRCLGKAVYFMSPL